MSGPEMRAYVAGAVLVKTNDGAGWLIDLGARATVTVSPRWEDDYDLGLFTFEHRSRFLGFDVQAETREDGRMLYVANFDDLFGRMRAEATEQPAIGPAVLELPRGY